MATHGRTGLPHLLYGSVTEAVLAHCTVPVFVVHARPGEEPAPPFTPYTAPVLVPQDGSTYDAPEHPFIRGTAKNPDTYFQAREASNPFYTACPDTVQRAMDRFALLTGGQYHLFDYAGAPDAERVNVVMGSGAETAEETANVLNTSGERVGVLKVRLFRPFVADRLIEALPPTLKAAAVLDRTKEPGSAGEPLFQDVITAFSEAGLHARIVGGPG